MMPLFIGLPKDYGTMLDEIDKGLKRLGRLKTPKTRMRLYEHLMTETGKLNRGDRDDYSSRLEEIWAQQL
jgi:hypothetical protein